MILAAGLGTRMRPLTLSTPKPMLTVGGAPMLEHLVRKLARAGRRDLVINTHYLADQVTQHFGDGSAFGVRIRWSHESELLESGGGVHRALPLLGPGPFALTSGDTWHDFDWQALPTLGPDRDLHLVLTPQPDYLPRADFHCDDRGTIGAGSKPFTWARIAIVRPELFAYAPAGAFALMPLFKRAIDASRVQTSVFEGDWLDVGTPEQLEALRQRWNKMAP